MEIVYLLIVGTVFGLLGKFLAPGDRDNTPLWLTILCGVGGVAIGNAVFYAAFDSDSTLLLWALSIGIAALLVMLASTLTGRNTTKPRARR